MDNPEIKIACEGSTTVILDELHDLHHYKERTREHYEKFKTSVLRLGFKFPIFFWEDKDGTKYIVDAHGRKQFLMEMRTEGYKVPPLPAIRIFAENKKEAKEAVLAQESKLGKIQEPELYEFINEEDFELNEDELDTFTEIYELDMEFNNDPAKHTDEEEQKTKKESCQLCTTYHNNNHTQ